MNNIQTMNNAGVTKETAHPLAKELMESAFFWDLDDPNGPFGSEGGEDGMQQYLAWRTKQGGSDTFLFIDRLLYKDWGFPVINLYERDPMKVMSSMDSSQYRTIDILLDMDHAIIGIVYTKIVLDGELTYKLQQIAIASIERQIHPKMENLYQPSVWKDRKHKYIMKALLASFDLRPTAEDMRTAGTSIFLRR
jgi:uncharacterized protein YfeS